MKLLRTAVIGLGRIGWKYHVPQVASHNGFELTAVVDPLQERLDETAADYGAKGYRDCDALLETENLDLVVIASPTQFHADQTVAAFEHGCHVLCDKPMAPSLSEAERMVDAMKANGQKLMVYQPQRAGAMVVALRKILRKDLIGPVYMIKATRTAYARRNDWQAFRKYGGGMLNNYGAHLIDVLLHLSGSRAKRVCCALRTVASLGDADDVVKVVIETDSGAVLDVDINMASAHSMAPWQILGKYGSIILDEKKQGWKVRYCRPEALASVGVSDGLAAPGRQYGSGEKIPWQDAAFPIADFKAVDYYAKCYEYFALGGKPFVPVAASLELMRVLDACREDAGAA